MTTAQEPTTIPRASSGSVIECHVPTSMSVCRVELVERSEPLPLFSLSFSMMVVALVGTFVLFERMHRKYLPGVVEDEVGDGLFKNPPNHQAVQKANALYTQRARLVAAQFALVFGLLTAGTILLTARRNSNVDLAVATSVLAAGFVEAYRFVADSLRAREQSRRSGRPPSPWRGVRRER